MRRENPRAGLVRVAPLFFGVRMQAWGWTAVAVVVAMSAVFAKRGVQAPVALAATAPLASVASAIEPAGVLAEDAIEPLVHASLERSIFGADDANAGKTAQYAPRYYDGRPIRPVKTVWLTVTAYSPDARSCGKWADGVTACNKSVWTNGMKLVAADTRFLPMKTLLSIPGYDGGKTVPVLDRGGAIKGARLDVLYPTHARARQWGVQKLPVTIWEYADE